MDSLWTTIIGNNVPIPGGRIACANTLTALRATRTATVATRGTIAGRATMNTASGSIKGVATEALRGIWQFDTHRGRFLGEQMARVVAESGVATVAARSPSPFRLDEHDRVSVRFISAL